MLNAPLVYALRALYGEVKVQNENMVGDWTRVVKSSQLPTGVVRKYVDFSLPPGGERGERYILRCPHCNDRKPRMHIGHLFGRYDAETKSSYPFGWKCYNDDCERDVGNSFLMLQELKPLMDYSDSESKVVDLDTAESAPTECNFAVNPISQPGRTVTLNSIQPGSAYYPAIEYLHSRGLDLQKLATDYDVQFIVQGYRYKIINNRIFIPFYRDRQLIGWQAREVPCWGQSDMKYFTSPNGLGGLLYGLGTAVKSPVSCVVEGVFDRFAVGDSSFALLTKSFRSTQLARLRQCSNISSTELFVILLDPLRSMADCLSGKPHHIEVATTVLSSIFADLSIRSRRVQVLPVSLPEGHDPASFGAKHGKASLADFLEQHLRKSGYAEFGKILAGSVLSSSAVR